MLIFGSLKSSFVKCSFVALVTKMNSLRYMQMASCLEAGLDDHIQVKLASRFYLMIECDHININWLHKLLEVI